MKLIEILQEDELDVYSIKHYGGWMNSKGFYVSVKPEGHWDMVDQNPSMFGFPENINSDDLSWKDAFNNGWIRVVSEPKHGYLSFDGNMDTIKQALKKYRIFLNKLFIANELQQIHISNMVGVNGKTISNRQQFNEFLNN